ncbi:hypothetical protein CCMA1212_001490 [Trichoderma ghanense]|uniref:Uncharacterized protein n=1 Tax=Trichoderma ghanense TaxID=65468 RepID=A0ABY2HBS9_9HYPO
MLQCDNTEEERFRVRFGAGPGGLIQGWPSKGVRPNHLHLVPTPLPKKRHTATEFTPAKGDTMVVSVHFYKSYFKLGDNQYNNTITNL